MITYTTNGSFPVDPLVRQRINEWNTVFNLVNQYFKDEKKSSLWMFTENPLLGNVKPTEMIKMGRFEKLKTFILIQMDERQEP